MKRGSVRLLSGATAALAVTAFVGAEEPPAKERAWLWSGDLLARAEAVRDTPNPALRELERARLRARPGLTWRPGSSGLKLGARALISLSTDTNRDNTSRFDNFRSDALALDRLFVRYEAEQAPFALSVGRFENPFRTAEMLWDRDIQAQGVAAEVPLPGGGPFHGHRFTAAVLARMHLHHDRTRLFGIQWSGSFGVDAEASAAYYRFDRIEALIPGGLARTNRLAPGGQGFLSDYEIGSVRLRKEWLLAGRPLRAHLELIHNLGAENLNDAVELRAQYGQVREAMQWRLRYTFQRVERDAVLAAFSADEWWFHTGHRGHLAGAALGLGHGRSVELAVIVQRRDDVDENLKRAFLDFLWSW